MVDQTAKPHMRVDAAQFQPDPVGVHQANRRGLQMAQRGPPQSGQFKHRCRLVLHQGQHPIGQVQSRLFGADE